MTRRTALIFAVLVTCCLAAITANLYSLRQRVERREQAKPLSVRTAEELKTAWPEGYEMFRLGGITADEFVKEAWTRAEASKP